MLDEIEKQFIVGVVILAGGSSRRMGQPKLLLPWGTTTVLHHLVQQWQGLFAAQIAVVSALDAHALHAELDRIGFPLQDRIFNPAAERGMFSSIQCAAAWPGWKPELTHIVVALGDQPHLKLDTLRALLEFGASHPISICQPSRNQHRKHPVLFPKTIFFNARNSSKPNLKAFLLEHTVEQVGFESDDPGLDFDMDTPADYDRIRGFWLS